MKIASATMSPNLRMASNGATPVPSTAVVKPTPDGADTVLDGKYAGSTPSTLRLAAGGYKARVGKTGFKSWERTVALGVGGDGHYRCGT